MLLAAFVTGLTGTPGRKVRYANPQNIDQTLNIALSVQEAEKQEKFSESYASSDNSLRRNSPSSPRRPSNESRGSVEAKHTANQTHGQRNAASRYKKPKTSGTRNAETKAALRCYECERFGHFGREFSTRQKRGQVNELAWEEEPH
jgi:hypothetical protein